MIKFVHDDLWVYDAEWVPDVEAGRRLYNLPQPVLLYDDKNMDNGQPIDYAGFMDADVIERMFRENPKYDAITNPRPFLKPILSQLVSLAFVRERGDKVSLHIVDPAPSAASLFSATGYERALLELFLHHAGKVGPQLVSWNGREADLPLIMQRAMVHNVEARAFTKIPEKPWLGRDYFERFSGWHVDVMDLIAGPERRNRPSLSEACAAMNIVGPKTMTGADVLDLWLEGTPTALRTIQHYCLLDCVRLYLIWLRLGRLAGFYPEDVARENAASALRQYEDMTAEHDKAYSPKTIERLAKLQDRMEPEQEGLPLGNHEDQAHDRTD